MKYIGTSEITSVDWEAQDAEAIDASNYIWTNTGQVYTFLYSEYEWKVLDENGHLATTRVFDDLDSAVDFVVELLGFEEDYA